MERDHELARLLGEFAHTLGTDFSIERILDHLVQRVADVLPVTAAGVMVMRHDDLRFAAASNDAILAIQRVQQDAGEGPCLEAFRTGKMVAIPDLGVDQRFPLFSPRAYAAGLAAVFTFPMRLDDDRLGALDLYRDTPGALSASDERIAQVLADVAAAYLFNARARREAADRVAELRHSTLHDPLTGLANRLLFHELLEKARLRAQRSHHTTAVLFVDLDRFKAVNDRFGHAVGDALLVAVAAALSGAVRPGDSLARLSGDEFVILCEDLTDPTQAERIAERIAHALREPFDVEGNLVSISASVGVAFSGPGESVPQSLLRDADFAMYQAKAEGGGQHRVGEHVARLAADRQAQLAVDLRDALARDELQLAYQPITRAGDGTLVGVEALLRWQRPDGGFVPPDVLVPIAERTGLIRPLGSWVLRQACTDFVRWRRTHGSAVSSVAVNVSAHQVIGPDFAETVAGILDDVGLDPACLYLEVTETVFLHDAARARAVLNRLREVGVRLSLDDFGTGYSSLTYLQQFHFDVLKLSGNFIGAITDDTATSRKIVASVVDLARALELTVVAEGIETKEQLTQVVDLGGELAQGYYLSRPLFAADLEARVLDLTSHGSVIHLPV